MKVDKIQFCHSWFEKIISIVGLRLVIFPLKVKRNSFLSNMNRIVHSIFQDQRFTLDYQAAKNCHKIHEEFHNGN